MYEKSLLVMAVYDAIWAAEKCDQNPINYQLIKYLLMG